METLYQRVAGLDVHKNNIVVCVRVTAGNGRVGETTRSFGTMTDDLLQLSDWLRREEVTHLAMESTGVLWKPVWNILEGGDWKMLLVNARELKQVPGRKSDVKDSQWIAQLLACGLLRSSYVPSRQQRDLRDLTRQRAQLYAEHTRCANRIHKVLQDAPQEDPRSETRLARPRDSSPSIPTGPVARSPGPPGRTTGVLRRADRGIAPPFCE